MTIAGPSSDETPLRPATASDAEALAAFGARAFVAKFGTLYASEDLATHLRKAHSPAAVAAEIASPAMRIALAERDGALTGYCKLVLRGGWPEHARGLRPIELKQLYTDPALTGLGIGSALTRWAFVTARECGADEIQLSVWSGNHDAQRFYARHGFVKLADVGFWVGDQRDEEYLFSKLLD
ncbi:MAG: GNAT family N-acetyltransferase [Novosphingobium sp.]